jgi:hypothetical protein
MEYIKSKFTGDAIFEGIMSFLCFLGSIFFIARTIKEFSGDLGDYLALLLSSALLLLIFFIFKHRKYIVIKKDKLIYYSILCPFGKTLYFDDYIGKIVVHEVANHVSPEVLYLIDKENRTAFKIEVGGYKRYKKIIRAIPLEEIDFIPTTKEYFKLLFGGKIIVTRTV